MYSKQLINNFRYIHSIQSNGSTFFIFDYYSDDFKVNEVHYINYFNIDQIYLKLNNIYHSFYYSKSHYLYIFHQNFMLHYDKKYIVKSCDSYKIKEKIHFFKLKKQDIDYNYFENSFFKEKSFHLFQCIYIYNSFQILELLKSFLKKICSNIFFNI